MDGKIETIKAIQKLNINIKQLVALTAIFAPPNVVEEYKKKNKTACVYPNTRRAKVKSGEKRGDEINGIKLDDNSYANRAIKIAIGYSPKNYTTCHIYPGTTYDPLYHTALPNLTLIPAPLSSLTDFFDEIIDLLKFRSYQLYGFYIDNVPAKPEDYDNLIWREEHNKSIENKDIKPTVILKSNFIIPPVNTFSKRDAITILTNRGYGHITSRNLCFSNRNRATGDWWFEPSFSLFENDLFIALYHDIKKELYLFKIPAGAINHPETFFYTRPNLERISSTISPENPFKDKLQRDMFDYKKYFIEEIKINN